ncbi:MAG: hypothetical protein WC412_07670 [Candidatus Omnitrophota bacterium]|jgi:hypothetical protein
MKLIDKKLKMKHYKAQVIIEYLIVLGAIIAAIIGCTLSAGALQIGVNKGLTDLQAGIDQRTK